MPAVRPRILPFPPGPQKIALAIEHHDRVFSAVEDIDIVLGVDPDRPDFLERPPVRQLCPILDDAVFEIAGANDDRHAGLSPDMLILRLSKPPARNNPPAPIIRLVIPGRGLCPRARNL